MKVLVTGGSGFVGRVLVRELLSAGHSVRLAIRRAASPSPSGVESLLVGEIDRNTEWAIALDGMEAVVHLAGRAHILREEASNPETAFLETNYQGTKRLADACRGRVSRFVYLSSIGVHGAGGNDAISERNPFAPHNPYAQSKTLAENYLRELAQRGDLDCRILRPPLVYGAQAPGNLARLTAYIRRRLPLPLGSVRNRRSLVGIDHLASAIRVLLEAESVSQPAYVIADRQVLSTPEIVQAIAQGLKVPAKLWPFPVPLLRRAGALAGRSAMVEQLIGNLEVNAEAFRREFGDLQPVATLDGLAAAAQESG